MFRLLLLVAGVVLAVSQSIIDIQKNGNNNPSSQNESRGLSEPRYKVLKRVRRASDSDEHKCNVVINEALITPKTATSPFSQFIELAEVCGKYAKPKIAHNTDGYVIIIQQRKMIGNELQNEIIFHSNLKGKAFKPSANQNEQHRYFLTIGNALPGATQYDVGFSEAESMFSNDHLHNGAIPAETDEPVAIILLKFTPSRHQVPIRKLRLKPRKDANGNVLQDRYDFTPLTTETTQIIKSHMVDQFIYGTSCPNDLQTFYRSIYLNFPENCNEEICSSELRTVTGTAPHSFSRCSQTISSFKSSSFRPLKPTPGEDNKCTKISNQHDQLNYPYRFQGKALSSTSMKLLLNSMYAVKFAQSDPEFFQGNAREVVAKLHGIAVKTLDRTTKREQDNVLLTPGKKRKREGRVLIQIDKFDRDWISNRIKESYKGGIAAEAKQLYKEFMDYKNPPKPSTSSQSNPGNTPVTQQQRQSTETITVSSSASITGRTPVVRQQSLGGTIPGASGSSTIVETPLVQQRQVTGTTRVTSSGSNAGNTPLTQQYPRPLTGSITLAAPQVNQAREPVTEPPKFSCSYTTFRRLLVLMGYRYGRINDRAAVMQRPDLTRWRGIHLKALKQNDEREKPKKLVYLDETWIDPHVRLAKGWAPDKCTSFREMAAYSYSKHKIGRGSRLIVFAAVMEGEVILESLHVYKIHKSKTTDDYHQNVNAEAFTKWMIKLSTELKNRKDKEGYIFVMDNASYHSKKTVPKKSEKKDVLYTWLQENQQRSGLTYQLDKKMRKWELEDLVDRVASQPQMEQFIYSLDQLLAKDGHEVRRLPPYHCHLNPIELVWGVIKGKIARQNTNQDLNTIKALVEKELKEYNVDALKNQFAHVKKLREQLWIDDGLFESFTETSMIIDVSEDDDAFDDEEDDESEDPLADDIPYGDEPWEMVDDVDLLSDSFAEEIELGSFMRPRPKKARCNNIGFPMRLVYDDNA